MTEKYILKKGYKEFPNTQNHHVEKFYQKRFRDNKGTKYFIDINKFETLIHPFTGEKHDLGYEYSVQLYKKNSHKAVNMTFLNSWTLDEVEENIETLFSTGLYDYYELDNK